MTLCTSALLALKNFVKPPDRLAIELCGRPALAFALCANARDRESERFDVRHLHLGQKSVPSLPRFHPILRTRMSASDFPAVSWSR
jgi:hypothetical protein